MTSASRAGAERAVIAGGTTEATAAAAVEVAAEELAALLILAALVPWRRGRRFWMNWPCSSSRNPASPLPLLSWLVGGAGVGRELTSTNSASSSGAAERQHHRASNREAKARGEPLGEECRCVMC